MLVIHKNKLFFKGLVVFLCLAMANTGYSADAGSARIIPQGKVSIIKDGKVVGEFSKESPLPAGSVLRCEAECVVRLEDVYMVAEPDTVFSVSPAANGHELYVQEGTVYYLLSKSARPLQFRTPAGDATTGDVTVFGNELRGYVRANKKQSEIGVIQGGSIVFITPSGDFTVTPGNAITAKDSDTGPAAGIISLTRNQKWALGAAGAAVLTAGIITFSDGGGGSGGNVGSPSSP
jgi:hypothetical protein